MEAYTSSVWSGYLGIRGYSYGTTTTTDSAVTVSAFSAGQMYDAYYYGLTVYIQIRNQSGNAVRSASANSALTSHPYGWGHVCRTSTVSYSFPRGASAYTVTVYCTAYGETTSSGYGAFPGNTGWTHMGSVTVPALATSGTPPSAIATLSGTTGTVTWTHGSGVKTKSLVDIHLNEGSWLTVHNGAYKSSHQVANLLPNSKYEFAVYDGNAAAWSGRRDSNAVYTEPSPPSDLAAAADGTEVHLAWATNAYEASTVELQRSATLGFSSYTVVYNGPAKSSHTDSPPSGTVYYRVRATAPGGTTGYSNTASATTMLAPSAPTGFNRVAPFSTDVVALSWTNQSTEVSPYSSLEIQISPSSDFEAPATVTVGGATSSTTVARSPGERLYLRIRANNPVGASGWAQIGPVYTSAPPMQEAPASVSGRAVTFTWLDPFAYPSDRISPAATVEASTSEDGETWSDWEALVVSPLSEAAYQATKAVSERCYIRSRASLSYGVPSDGETRTTGWAEGGAVLVESVPQAPIVSYDKGTLMATVTLPSDIDTPRTVALAVGNSTVDTRTVDEEPQAYSVKVKDSSRMSISATVETAMWPDPVPSNVLEIDMDTLPVFVDGKRHLVYLVAEDGTATPAAISSV